MANLKATQRDQLIMEFGILIQPFVELAKSPNPADISSYRIASAKVQSGDASWRQSARAVCNFASDIFLNVEFQKLSHVNEVFLRDVSRYINTAEQTQELNVLQENCILALASLKEEFYKNLSKIPIEWEPEIFPANTPFTSYLKIKESIALVNERLHYFDRYLKPEFFETFLRNIDRSKEIRIVTTTGNSSYGANGCLAVSDLVKREFNNYQLIAVSPSDLHDRNLRVDNTVFNLGPGADRAGMCLTNFGPADSSMTALKSFDGIIGSGNVIHQS